jgi:hypothetical protein
MFSSLFYSDTGAQTQSIIPIGEVSNRNDLRRGGGGGGIFRPFFRIGAGGASGAPVVQKIGFDDVLYMINQAKTAAGNRFIIINTMSAVDQDFLIRRTISYQIEESRINEILDDFRTDLDQYIIVVYGRNCADDTVERKYQQLAKLGFRNVYVYYGGMFEWLLLQDVYGEDCFPVDSIGGVKKDPLSFAPSVRFSKTPR